MKSCRGPWKSARRVCEPAPAGPETTPEKPGVQIALAQIDSTIGAFEKNSRKIAELCSKAARKGAELVIFPELALTGYPPRDLLERPDFVEAAGRALEGLSGQISETCCLLGTIRPNPSGRAKPLFNSAVLLGNGQILAEVHKRLLPTYDVFDEARYFAPGPSSDPVEFKGLRLGVTICEDAWNEAEGCAWCEHYADDPVAELAEKGAQAIINISASPFTVGKRALRQEIFSKAAARFRLPFIFCNAVGGQDCLVFDGSSMAIGPDGRLFAASAEFREELLLIDISRCEGPISRWSESDEAQILSALELALKDYMGKCGIRSVTLGLSGGIDSALTAAIAVRALGPENVLGVLMPSAYTSKESIEDARQLAEALEIETVTLPITDIFASYIETLSDLFEGHPVDVTEENIQARIRGNLLMAISNKFGHMVLSTGNKSELAVGYCTLYGDMTGGYALISDLPKTMVYKVARYVNSLSPVIPERVFVKPPSAELRPGQTDQDDLPPYEVLDPILELYLEQRLSARQIVEEGFRPEDVKRVISLVERNEYKRFQAAPGPKITSKAFCCGRRYPIAQGFCSYCDL